MNETTFSPTTSPSWNPTGSPSLSPSLSTPTTSPVVSTPTASPIVSTPTSTPTKSPSAAPSRTPTHSPVVSQPTATPSQQPTRNPTSTFPSATPSFSPSRHPISSLPTSQPSFTPTIHPIQVHSTVNLTVFDLSRLEPLLLAVLVFVIACPLLFCMYRKCCRRTVAKEDADDEKLVLAPVVTGDGRTHSRVIRGMNGTLERVFLHGPKQSKEPPFKKPMPRHPSPWSDSHGLYDDEDDEKDERIRVGGDATSAARTHPVDEEEHLYTKKHVIGVNYPGEMNWVQTTSEASFLPKH